MFRVEWEGGRERERDDMMWMYWFYLTCFAQEIISGHLKLISTIKKILLKNQY